ncbi:MAG: MBL fold metallo-hydrolase [Bacteroidota bacterium]
MKTWITKSGYKITRIVSGRSNAFLLTDGEKNILIDTSVSRMWSRLRKRIEQSGVNRIDYLILTHAHFDHAGSAANIREVYKAKVIVHEAEAQHLSAGKHNLPVGTTVISKFLVNVIGKRFLSGFKSEPCLPDIPVDATFDLSNIGFNAYLMHTPGHTAGSVSLIVDDEIAIVGDTLFGVFGWTVFPPFAEDEKLMITSWGKLLETKCSEFLPAHGSANSRSLVQKDYNKRKQ